MFGQWYITRHILLDDDGKLPPPRPRVPTPRLDRLVRFVWFLFFMSLIFLLIVV